MRNVSSPFVTKVNSYRWAETHELLSRRDEYVDLIWLTQTESADRTKSTISVMRKRPTQTPHDTAKETLKDTVGDYQAADGERKAERKDLLTYDLPRLASEVGVVTTR